jgi:transposase
MIVIGTDAHKRSYACAAVAVETGELRENGSAQATQIGHAGLLRWARGLGEERVWAVEDCRNVSAKLERFLIARGEKVIRIPPHLMAGRRRSCRQAGKSDPIDALSVARAAVEEGIETFPVAALEGPAREIKLLLDHREDLVAERTRIQNRLRWLLHDRWPEFGIPAGALSRPKTQDSLARRLARTEHDVQVRVMREQLKRIREITRHAQQLETELAQLVVEQQPRLLALHGIGTLTAARLVVEIAGIERFKTPAKLARLAGIAPIPASSGARHRHRLDRHGNRQLNAAVHRMAITQLHWHQPAKDYVDRKMAEGKSKREAIRCLKRHLIRTIFNAMTPHPDQQTTPSPSNSLT